MRKLYYPILLLLTWGLVLAGSARAARFYFEPITLTSQPHSAIALTAYFDPEGAKINALEGDVVLPSNLLTLNEVRDADSLVSTWIQSPALAPDGGRLHFAGIIPNGFSGVLSPFYQGARPGKLFTLILKVQSAGEGVVSWQNTQALLNDGQAGQASVTTTASRLSFAPNLSNSAPVTELAGDTTSPESFAPVIGRQESLYNGRWFVAFSTHDHQSGIARYEVAEHRGPLPDTTDWQVATSPYQLTDQSLSSYVSVRALDLAGNERVATLPPQATTTQRYSAALISLIILICFVVFFARYYFPSRR